MKKTLLALTLATLALAASAAAAPPACAGGCTTVYSPRVANAPFGITRGPLGSMWFSLDTSIGRIDQQGDITTYAVPTPNANVGWMTASPENTVWFAERGSGKIGTIDETGRITEYALPTPTALPQGIVFAGDGDVYVPEQGANAIARLDPATGDAVDFPVPTPNAGPQSGTLGPDGAIWFVERPASKVGRMTLDGHVTEYPLAPGSFPNRIVTGPDGALWFSELRANKVGRITTDGVLTEYPLPGGPVGIAVGRDRQLYVATFTSPGVTRLDLDGTVTGRWSFGPGDGALLLAPGFGLDVWVTDPFSAMLTRLTPYGTGR